MLFKIVRCWESRVYANFSLFNGNDGAKLSILLVCQYFNRKCKRCNFKTFNFFNLGIFCCRVKKLVILCLNQNGLHNHQILKKY